MTDKLSREAVLRVADECYHKYSEWNIDIERFAAAMYAAGAEGMRERAADACDAEAVVWKKPKYKFATAAAEHCARHIRALPITTNTEVAALRTTNREQAD